VNIDHPILIGEAIHEFEQRINTKTFIEAEVSIVPSNGHLIVAFIAYRSRTIPTKSPDGARIGAIQFQRET
jgi:hypothetical protein